MPPASALHNHHQVRGNAIITISLKTATSLPPSPLRPQSQYHARDSTISTHMPTLTQVPIAQQRHHPRHPTAPTTLLRRGIFRGSAHNVPTSMPGTDNAVYSNVNPLSVDVLYFILRLIHVLLTRFYSKVNPLSGDFFFLFYFKVNPLSVDSFYFIQRLILFLF